MKKSLLITLLLSCCLQTSAQKIRFTDNNNLWHWYHIHEGVVNFYKYDHFTSYYTGDTILNGYNYKILTNAGFVREDTTAQIVYMKRSWQGLNDSTEKVLYNYNLQVGDTFTQTFASNTFIHYVSNIDSTKINNVWHRIWHFMPITTNATPDYYVVEGVGCLTAPFFPLEPMVFHQNFKVTCFKRNGITPPFIPPAGNNFTNADSCVLSVDNIENFSSRPIIYPNPANSFSYITLPDNLSGQFVIYNTTGQIAKQMQFHNVKKLSIGELPASGIYFYQVKTNNGDYTYRDKFIYY